LGLAILLIELLARRALECGIAAFTALFLANNRPVAELAREGHARVVIAEGAAHLYATLATRTRGHVDGSAKDKPARRTRTVTTSANTQTPTRRWPGG
jgi:hypothetical protein